MPEYMEETRDSGIGLKGTIDCEPPKYGENNPSWAAVYAGIRVEHNPDSYPEVLQYDMAVGDSVLASTCGHVKNADPAPIVFGFTPADLYPVRSRKAASVMHELLGTSTCASIWTSCFHSCRPSTGSGIRPWSWPMAPTTPRL
jgi:hypothetical protein